MHGLGISHIHVRHPLKRFSPGGYHLFTTDSSAIEEEDLVGRKCERIKWKLYKELCERKYTDILLRARNALLQKPLARVLI